MKKLLMLVVLSVAIGIAVGNSYAQSPTYVKGYIKKNGTYVMPYYKTTPDVSKFNNYGTKGNINPFTGKEGTVVPFKIENLFKTKNLFK